MTVPRLVELRVLDSSVSSHASFASSSSSRSLTYGPPEVPPALGSPLNDSNHKFASPPPPSPVEKSSPSSSDLREDASIVATQLRRALAATEPVPCPPSPAHREHVFRSLLAVPEIDIDELRRVVWAHGVPDRPWARPVAWKLFAGYLPADNSEWDSVLSTQRSAYWELVAKLTVDPSVGSPEGDHPLSVDDGSRWAEYFRDRTLRESIEKDVQRTYPDLHRFVPLRDALHRILFVYSKSSDAAPDGYRQGMNELAAPLLLCFSEAPFADLSDSEADAYFCFRAVMRDAATMYVVRETEELGVGRQMCELQALLRIKDPELDDHLTRLGIGPRFYALRWMRLWLAREFMLPDVMRLWDSLLATEVRMPWLRYICVAMLLRIREELLAEDFAGCMKLLLHYPEIDVAELLQIADRLRVANVTIIRSARRR